MSTLPSAFSIGVSPIADKTRWMKPDQRLVECLAEKDRLISAIPDKVFMAEVDTAIAQQEASALLAAHLTKSFPNTYRADGGCIEITGVEQRVQLARPGGRILEDAACMVSDDLVVMRRSDEGWRLVAASLCFPTFWSLEEKFGKSITTIHQPVPGFGADTRNAKLVERIFDNLAPVMPVQRNNWSIHEDGKLHQSEPLHADIATADIENLYLRREYQTLTKLPRSGDILFTIRVSTDPITVIEKQPGLCELLARRLRELEPDGLQYKGLSKARDRLADFLQSAAEYD